MGGAPRTLNLKAAAWKIANLAALKWDGGRNARPQVSVGEEAPREYPLSYVDPVPPDAVTFFFGARV
jgi:hypothetical protein